MKLLGGKRLEAEVPLGFMRPVGANINARGWSGRVGPAGDMPRERLVLAEGFQPARLETRTKESNMYASRRVANP